MSAIYRLSIPKEPRECRPFLLGMLSLLLGSALLACFIASCAMSPQTVALTPLIDVPSRPVGGDRELALEVVDQRSKPSFGSRGGVYDTALISPRTDVAKAVRAALAERLRASGFRVVPARFDVPLSIRVSIKRIDYMASAAPLANEVRARAAIEALVRKDNRTLTGEYEAGKDYRMTIAPDESENERILNEVVSQALAQLLKDDAVWNLLAE